MFYTNISVLFIIQNTFHLLYVTPVYLFSRVLFGEPPADSDPSCPISATKWYTSGDYYDEPTNLKLTCLTCAK